MCEKPSRGSFLPCVNVCVHTCDHECIYVWEEGILPAVFFPEPLPAPPSRAHNPQSRRRRVRPQRDPTHQRRQRRADSVSLSSELCLFPPLTERDCKSCSHEKHSHIPPSSLCIAYDLAEVNPEYVRASARMCVLRVLAVFSTQPHQKIRWEMWF